MIHILSRTNQPTFRRSRCPEPTSPQPCCAPANKKQVDEYSIDLFVGFAPDNGHVGYDPCKCQMMLIVISATELVIENSPRVCHRKDLNFSVVCIEGGGGGG